MSSNSAPVGLWARLYRPIGLKPLALFYRQLATMIDSGVSIKKSLKVSMRPACWKPYLPKIQAGVQQGDSLTEQFQRYPQIFLPWHLSMIEAAEETGNLPSVLKELAKSCEIRVQNRRLILREIFYPVLVFHALFLLKPLPELITGSLGFGDYVFEVAKWILPLYVIVFSLFIGLRLGAFSPSIRRMVLTVVQAIPVVGGAILKLGIARFATALQSLYEAGVRIQQALPVAGKASGNEVIYHASHQMAKSIEMGSNLIEAMKASAIFPSQTLSMVETGEEAGRLDTVLAKLAEIYEEEARMAIRILSQAFAFSVYIVVALMVAYRVITFFSGYANMLQSV